MHLLRSNANGTIVLFAFGRLESFICDLRLIPACLVISAYTLLRCSESPVFPRANNMSTVNQSLDPLLRKLDEMAGRYAGLQDSLNDPALLTNSQRLVATSKEAGQLEPIVSKYHEYLAARENVVQLQLMANNKADVEIAELAEMELDEATSAADAMLEALKNEFVAAEDNAVNSFFLEIRAGTGGEEAALFCRVLYEMYRRYCETRGVEV